MKLDQKNKSPFGSVNKTRIDKTQKKKDTKEIRRERKETRKKKDAKGKKGG